MAADSLLTDLNYLKDASAGNKVFIKEMIEIFLRQTPAYLSELKKSGEEQRWEEFRKVLHKLKPTITMMGIRKGDTLVKEIEYVVKHCPEADKINAMVGELEKICNASYLELKEDLVSLGL